MSVGEVIEPYDSDKMFPFYGFGGVPPGTWGGYTSHCFAISGDENNPEINGIQKVAQTYRETLPKIDFSGPTYFEYILKKFIKDV